jgi:hypothetical protein
MLGPFVSSANRIRVFIHERDSMLSPFVVRQGLNLDLMKIGKMFVLKFVHEVYAMHTRYEFDIKLILN